MLALRAEARTAPGSKGRLARSRAVSRTLSVSCSKLARVRARGPLGVYTDSRISKRPLGRATTYATAHQYIPTTYPLGRAPAELRDRGVTRWPRAATPRQVVPPRRSSHRAVPGGLSGLLPSVRGVREPRLGDPGDDGRSHPRRLPPRAPARPVPA